MNLKRFRCANPYAKPKQWLPACIFLFITIFLSTLIVVGGTRDGIAAEQIIIGVIDDGLDPDITQFGNYDCSNLKDHLIPIPNKKGKYKGKCFVCDDDTNTKSACPEGQVSHGTSIACIIASELKKHDNIKIMPLRVLEDCHSQEWKSDSPSQSMCAPEQFIYDPEEDDPYQDALKWAIDKKKVNVINISLGGPLTNVDTEFLYREAFKKGIVIVAAAGNSGMNIDNIKPRLVAGFVDKNALPRCPDEILSLWGGNCGWIGHVRGYCNCECYPATAYPAASVADSIVAVAALNDTFHLTGSTNPNKSFKYVGWPIKIEGWLWPSYKMKWKKLKNPTSKGSNYGKKNVDIGAVGPDTSRATPLVTAAVAKLMDWHLSNCEPDEIKTGKALVKKIKNDLLNKCVKTSDTLAGKLLTGGYLDEKKLVSLLSSKKKSLVCGPGSVSSPCIGSFEGVIQRFGVPWQTKVEMNITAIQGDNCGTFCYTSPKGKSGGYLINGETYPTQVKFKEQYATPNIFKAGTIQIKCYNNRLLWRWTAPGPGIRWAMGQPLERIYETPIDTPCWENSGAEVQENIPGDSQDSGLELIQELERLVQ